jgi:hypothetical protein
MLLQTILDQLRQRFSEWMDRQQRLRYRRLKVIRLEDRRLPDASFALFGDVLILEGFEGASDVLDISFDGANDEFHFELSAGDWISSLPTPLDPAISVNGNLLTVALPELGDLRINGSPTLRSIQDSGNAFIVHHLDITQAAAVEFSSAHDFGIISVQANSLILNDLDDLQVDSLSIRDNLNISAVTTIFADAESQLSVGEHAEWNAASIRLTGTSQFGTLTFTATDDVVIAHDGDLELTGVNSATSLSLDVNGTLTDTNGTRLTVTEQASLTAADITLGDRATDSIELHRLQFSSTGDVSIETDTNLILSGDSVGDTVTVRVDGELQLESGASISAAGDLRLDVARGLLVDTGSSITTDSGFLIATTEDGGIQMDGRMRTETGSVLLWANGAGNDIEINGNIRSSGGHLTLIATDSVLMGPAASVLTFDAGTVHVEAITGSIDMNAAATFAADGDLSLTARQNLIVSTITSRNANVNVVSTSGSVLDADVSSSAVNISANKLRLQAGEGVGSTGIGSTGIGGDTIETSVAVLAARAGQRGINVREADALTVDDVSVTTQRVQSDGSLRSVTVTSSDLRTTNNGSIHIQNLTGSFTLNEGTAQQDGSAVTADGSGRVTIRTLGSDSDILVNAAVRTGTGDILLNATRDLGQAEAVISNAGSISLLATRDILQLANGDIRTNRADVLIRAGRDWMMDSETEITSTGGAVGGRAVTGEIQIARINAAHVALNSAQSVVDVNGAELNVVAETLSVAANGILGGRSNPDGSSGNSADAMDTQVDQIAVMTNQSIAIHERTGLTITQIGPRTIGGQVFDAVTGLQSLTSDIFLNVQGDIAIQNPLNASTGSVRIVAAGDVTQTNAGLITTRQLSVRQESVDHGSVTLMQDNDVDVLAVTNKFDGGEIRFHDVDELLIDSVAAQYAGQLLSEATTGITATGGDILVRSVGDLTIRQSISSLNQVEDRTAATGETITLEAIDGNILLDGTAGSILITTDEAAGSNAITGDQVVLLADSDRSDSGDLDGDGILDSFDSDIDGDGILNESDSTPGTSSEGRVEIRGDVTFSTDGGVAKTFGPRPEVGEDSTAFFEFVSDPLPLAIDNAPASWDSENANINAFFVVIGTAGEENLQVDVDWQDPIDETGVATDAASQAAGRALNIQHQLSSERTQQFLVAAGGVQNTVGHLYTIRDYTAFQKLLNQTTIVVDFSVSHHSSIRVEGHQVTQTGITQSVPGRDIASSDNANTSPNIFENGIALFKIPTVTPAPPALFASGFTPRVDRPVVVAPFENTIAFSVQVTGDATAGAVSGSLSSTEVYFQIRRQYESDGPSEIVIEKITDSRLISSREAFEKFVQQNSELQDGAGYEIWLISETGGQKVERPIVEFEITGGRPGTASDDSQNPQDSLDAQDEGANRSSQKPQLKDLPFEQPSAQPESSALPDSQTLISPDGPTLSADTSTITATSAVTSPSDGAVTSPAHGTGMSETSEMSTDESAMPVSDETSDESVDEQISSGMIAGLAVSRFRRRQKSSQTDQRPFSKASQFMRNQFHRRHQR